jgi:hypothetical protein
MKNNAHDLKLKLIISGKTLSRDALIENLESALEREREASEEHHPTGFYLGLESALQIVSALQSEYKPQN